MLKLYLLILSTVVAAGCDSVGPDGERLGLPPTLPLPGDTSGTPTPTPSPNPNPVYTGNLRYIGQVGTWETVGTGYPTEQRYVYGGQRRGPNSTQMTRARTLSGDLALGASFSLVMRLNFGGYDHRDGVWREMNDSIAVQGSYVRAGHLLVLEPESCTSDTGPVLGIAQNGEVALYNPPRPWEHMDTAWMRFALDAGAAAAPSPLPAGTYVAATVAAAYKPCEHAAFPYYLGGNRYESKSLVGVSARITETRLALELTYRNYSSNWPYGPGTSSTSTETVEARYERQGDLVIGTGESTTVPLYQYGTPRFWGMVRGDTLVLHDVQTSPYGGQRLVVKVPLK